MSIVLYSGMLALIESRLDSKYDVDAGILKEVCLFL